MTGFILSLVVGFFAALLVADFASGLAHWWGDRHARVDSRVWRAMARNHIDHHATPRAFVAKGYWTSCWESWLAALLVLMVAARVGLLSAPVMLFAALMANANQVHRWSHGLPAPRWVHVARRLRLIQKPRNHSHHHRTAHDSHYCVITPLLNPWLDRLRFWRALDVVLAACGHPPRRDAQAIIRPARLAVSPAATPMQPR